MARQFTLGEEERLKSRKQIGQLFSGGKKFSVNPYTVYYLVTGKKPGSLPSRFPARFGIGVPGKNFKKAVDRNRIKRLTREAYRLQKISLLKKLEEKNLLLNVFFIFTGKEMLDYKLAENKVGVILKKLIKLVDENGVANS